MDQLARQTDMHDRPVGNARRQQRHRRAFTMTELLVVITLIILLLSLIVVAVNQAMRSAQRTNTQFLMNSISQALTQFKEDHGYYPPVLDDNRNLVTAPDPFGGSYDDQIQDWFSITTLAEYLIGWDGRAADGYGIAPGEVPFAGIRSPGSDGAWNATLSFGGTPGTGALADRRPTFEGKVYGPYLELSDLRLMAGIDGSGQLVFPGDVPDATFQGLTKVIVDYWGEPVRFYRRPYPPGSIRQSYRAVDYTGDGNIDPVPTLSDVYLLRPFEIVPGADVTTRFEDADGDRTSTRSLNAAEFALFSSGADRAFNPQLRYDDRDMAGNTLGTDLANEDNIVEVGP